MRSVGTPRRAATQIERPGIRHRAGESQAWPPLPEASVKWVQGPCRDGFRVWIKLSPFASYRSAQLGEFQPRRKRPGAGEFWNTALSASTPQAGPPPSYWPCPHPKVPQPCPLLTGMARPAKSTQSAGPCPGQTQGPLLDWSPVGH